MVTFQLSLMTMLFIRQIRCGKGVLDRGNCLGKGVEVKSGLAWRGSLQQHKKTGIWVSGGLGAVLSA